MLSDNINKMLVLTKELQEFIVQDLADTKNANHESLFNRNKTKVVKMNELLQTQEMISYSLNSEGELDEYRDSLSDLENELQKLHVLNDELANIVLPVNEVYKEILDDISNENGHLVEVNAWERINYYAS